MSSGRNCCARSLRTILPSSPTSQCSCSSVAALPVTWRTPEFRSQAVRWPEGFRCPRCECAGHYVLLDGTRKVFQCNACRHQTSLIAGTVFQGTKLPLTVWFLAIYLISQAKTGLSALALKRHLGVSYPTAWLIHHKLMRAMDDREDRYVLDGKVQVDDAYLGGERTGGKVGRGSENKVPFVAAVSLTEEDRPLRVPTDARSGFHE